MNEDFKKLKKVYENNCNSKTSISIMLFIFACLMLIFCIIFPIFNKNEFVWYIHPYETINPYTIYFYIFFLIATIFVWILFFRSLFKDRTTYKIVEFKNDYVLAYVSNAQGARAINLVVNNKREFQFFDNIKPVDINKYSKSKWFGEFYFEEKLNKHKNYKFAIFDKKIDEVNYKILYNINKNKLFIIINNELIK